MVLPFAPLIGFALKYGVPAWQLYQQAKAIREKGEAVKPEDATCEVDGKVAMDAQRGVQKPLTGPPDKQDWQRLRATAEDAVFEVVGKPPPRKPVALPVDNDERVPDG